MKQFRFWALVLTLLVCAPSVANLSQILFPATQQRVSDAETLTRFDELWDQALELFDDDVARPNFTMQLQLFRNGRPAGTYFYDAAGYYQLLTKTHTPVYRVPADRVAELNRLLGIACVVVVHAALRPDLPIQDPGGP